MREESYIDREKGTMNNIFPFYIIVTPHFNDM